MPTLKFGEMMSLINTITFFPLCYPQKKGMVEQEGKIYIGNCKESEYDGPKPVTDSDLNEINTQLNEDSFNAPSFGGTPRQGEHGSDDDLPF